MQVPDQLHCVECGGICGRLTHRPDDDPFQPGDWVAYRCADCLERFDMQLEDEDPEEFQPENWTGYSAG